MELSVLIGLVVLALVTLAIFIFIASVPLLWYLLAAALFFSGHLGPAFGCLVLGGLVSVFALDRRA